MAVQLPSCVIDGVNLTATQCEKLYAPPSLIDKIFGEPYLWVLLIIVVLGIILLKWKGKSKDDPSTKAWFGRDVRKELLTKEAKNRMENFGTKQKTKVHLVKGTSRVGIITKIEHDKILMEKLEFDKATRQKRLVPDKWVRIDRFKYRNYGLVAWLKALFGYGFKFMTITPDAYKATRADKVFDRKGNIKKIKKPMTFYIDPMVHLLNDSDIWTLSDERVIRANDEMILKAHHENIHGYEMDFLRRLAVQSPTVASAMEKLSHEQTLKEKDRKSRVSQYAS